MIIVKTIEELNSSLSSSRSLHKVVGVVPTMGALHSGHIYLVEASAKENDITVVTIFVNPTQFNDPEDLKKYPRNLDADIKLLEPTGCDIVFAPEAKTIYPEPDKRVFDFGKLSNIMEGEFRPGHFNGVAQVVSRLFEIIKPNRAYFGQKDFQQLAIIKEMTRQLNLPVEIIPCQTVRETDGLAMSSRNRLLSSDHRKNAPLIYKVLSEAASNPKKDIDELKRGVINSINSNPFLKVEYFEIVDSDTLNPISEWNQAKGDITGCIAVFAGNIRLIDNVFFHNFESL